jgi:hypothetical protein
MAEAHVVNVGLVNVSAVGTVIAEGDAISSNMQFSTEHRVIPNSSIPSSQGHPTIAQYLVAEAALNFLPKHVDQTFIVTAKDIAPYGSFYILTDADTNIPNANDWVKMTGDTALGPVFQFDDGGTDNRLRYIGTVTRQFQIHAQITSHSDTPNINIFMRICKNGDADTGIPSEQHRRMGAAGDEGNAGVDWIFELATNDYVEIQFSTDSAASPDFAGHAVTLTAAAID